MINNSNQSFQEFYAAHQNQISPIISDKQATLPQNKRLRESIMMEEIEEESENPDPGTLKTSRSSNTRLLTDYFSSNKLITQLESSFGVNQDGQMNVSSCKSLFHNCNHCEKIFNEVKISIGSCFQCEVNFCQECERICSNCGKSFCPLCSQNRFRSL